MPHELHNDPRQAATEVLSRWRDINDPPMIPSHDAPFWTALEIRDRGLAFELVHGVIRWRGTLDTIIQSVSNTPLDKMQPVVRAIAYLGTYQLLMLDGAADYATIDTSVKLTQKMDVVRAGGFINGILRSIQRLRNGAEPRTELSAQTFPLDGRRQMRLSKNIFPDPVSDLSRHLAAVTSHPEALISLFLHAWGKQKTIDILITDNARPMITLRSDDPTFIPGDISGLQAHQQKGWFIAATGWTDELRESIVKGVLHPQDPTAGRAAQQLIGMLDIKEKHEPSILDLCAGLGTKTLQMARAQPKGRIFAFDISEHKLAQLSRRVVQLGLKNVEILTAEKIKSSEMQRCFDAVLADVPCSNTGVLARRVQARWRWPKLDRAELARTQQEILRVASGLIRPGGIVVYSTCSIDPEENQKLVEKFLATSGGSSMKIAHQETILPVDSGDAAVRRDGGYICVLS
ncbi:MAG TPA: transcription antitermination factor NusB [Phycisphaerae bacterium]|nr:transcription antitermination factor NusB [Phycisphaerae bacterium]